MKSIHATLPLALLLPILASSCSEESSAKTSDLLSSAAEQVKGLDLSEMSTGDMSSKVTELIGGLVKQLGEVKDEASATAAATEMGPIADQLGALKKALGGEMPDLSSLSSAVQSFTTKFSADSGIMDALKPILEKLTALAS